MYSQNRRKYVFRVKTFLKKKILVNHYLKGVKNLKDN